MVIIKLIMARPGKAPKKAKVMTKGHVTTKVPKADRPSYRKGHLSKRTALVRSVIREVAGFAPYERKIMELVQIGGAKEDKKALKVAKKRLGTHRRGLLKREKTKEIWQKMRAK